MAPNQSALSVAAALADKEDSQLAHLASQTKLSEPTPAQKTKHRPQVSSSDEYVSMDGAADNKCGDEYGRNHCKNNQKDSARPPATPSAGKEVKVEDLQMLEKECMYFCLFGCLLRFWKQS
jgi:hypothetical protein